MKEIEKPVTFWYLEPIGSHTNAIFSQNLAEQEACPHKLCIDGERRNLWRCTHLEVLRFQEEREKLELRFRVFVQKGPNSQIRKWPFDATKKRKRKLAKVA